MYHILGELEVRGQAIAGAEQKTAIKKILSETPLELGRCRTNFGALSSGEREGEGEGGGEKMLIFR
ncbi:MAG: hypothetical protein EBE86_002725 [Hormoscilla sp. GUM202]|nr:hypothetical protein [Hormoscilla sp. GUM202]